MGQAKTKQNIIVICIALAVIVLSVFATVLINKYATGSSEGSASGHQNITLTDAVVTCRDRTTKSYGDRIRNLVTDNHSSRFDEKQYVYKVFLKMDLMNKREKIPKLHYVNCFVRAKNGDIRKYDVFKSDEERGKEKDDGTNMFGMPKK